MSAAGGLDRAELAARLALMAVPGLTARRALALVQQHDSGLTALRHVRTACGDAVDSALRSERLRERVRRALDAIQRDGIEVVPLEDERLPIAARERLGEDAPLLLFALGDTALLQAASIAVVGSRRATEYGLDMAEEIGAGLARAGVCVTSGLALGIDAAAHSAALDAGGATIGVLGCGVDVFYPRENAQLQRRIAAEGLLLSELLPGEPPKKQNFPHRNRIISALSTAVVVVEAARTSGAVRTADHAAKQGLNVYGVMNAMNQPTFEGVHELLRDGGRPFIGVAELLRDEGLLALSAPDPSVPCPNEPPPPSDPLHAAIWDALRRQALHVDQLAGQVGLDTQAALVALLELELQGRVEQRAGQRFARVRRAARRGGAQAAAH